MAEENGRAKGRARGCVKGRREDGGKRRMGEGRKKAKESRVVPHPKLNPGCATGHLSVNQGCCGAETLGDTVPDFFQFQGRARVPHCFTKIRHVKGKLTVSQAQLLTYWNTFLSIIVCNFILQ